MQGTFYFWEEQSPEWRSVCAFAMHKFCSIMNGISEAEVSMQPEHRLDCILSFLNQHIPEANGWLVLLNVIGPAAASTACHGPPWVC